MKNLIIRAKLKYLCFKQFTFVCILYCKFIKYSENNKEFYQINLIKLKKFKVTNCKKNTIQSVLRLINFVYFLYFGE